MTKLIPIREAKAKFSEVLNLARYRKQQFFITKKNVPWAVIIGVDEYEDLLDQLDTMTEQLDTKFQKSLKKSIQEYQQGEVGAEADIHRILRSKKS